jgi:hypothetical protein
LFEEDLALEEDESLPLLLDPEDELEQDELDALFLL